jgi:hypothetical protein
MITTFGFSKESQDEINKFKILPYEDFKYYSELDDNRISIALFENFPFGKELNIELEKIISFDKENIYFKGEFSIINYKYYFYNEFYNFLFMVFTDFKENDKELELLVSKTIGKDFETKLKANINYGKSVSKSFFSIYPQLKTQFIIQHPFKAFNKETNKIIAQGSSNRLVEWYSTEKFQRLIMFIDLFRNKKKDKRNKLLPGDPAFELYREIIKEKCITDFLKLRKPLTHIIRQISDREKYNNDLCQNFYVWKKRNAETYNEIEKEEVYKLIKG